MSRRPNTSRRLGDAGSIPFVGSFLPKSRPSPLLSIGLVVVGSLLIIGYLYHGSGGAADAFSRLEGNQLHYLNQILHYFKMMMYDLITRAFSFFRGR
uniref:Uncharacterized protein At3g49720-like n=1 Tax=Nicotiana sylvestris TaxID=4096 RepID=A0A1U7YXA5_NICSY|nr:PREDICTED: uncharacterized protein At3g49720-like [Nicotiana sylvestris]